METEPLKEIRDIRRRISIECDDDPEKVFAYYVAYQEEMKASGNFSFANRASNRKAAAIATEQSDPPKSPVDRKFES